MASVATEQPLWLMSSLHCYRLQTNRSPVESPPTAKKFLRSSCSQQPQQHRSLVAIENIDDTACKENRSILKRVDCSRSKSWHAGQTPRRVNFHQNVAVVAYDRSDGEHVCYQSQQLNTEPRDRREFVSRTLLARVHSNKSTSSSSSFDGDSTSRQHCAPLTLIAGGGRSVDTGRQSSPGARPLPSVLAAVDNSLPPVSIDFTFHEDRGGQLWLRFTIPLGRGVAAGDALVKANVAGNKVRVLGTRTVVRDAASPTRQEFATRYALPMDVDPYAISARMDSAGHLFVEAPVMTGERRHRTISAAADCTTI